MVLAHPENEPLLAALRARDAQAVGPALLTATLLVPGKRPEGEGELEPALQRHDDGTLDLLAFTSAGAAQAFSEDFELVEVLGGDAVNIALRVGARALRLDLGQDHSGFLPNKALAHLSGQPRSAGNAPFDPAGAWATDEIAEAVRGAVQADDQLRGAWLSDRDGRPSVLLDVAADDPAPVVNRVIAALRPVVTTDGQIDFVIVSDARRAEAEALGEPLA